MADAAKMLTLAANNALIKNGEMWPLPPAIRAVQRNEIDLYIGAKHGVMLAMMRLR